MQRNAENNLIENHYVSKYFGVGLASLATCVLGLLGYLVFHHKVAFVVSIKAILAIYFLCFLPGYITQRYIFRIRNISPFEYLGTSVLVGLITMPPAWYILRWLNLAWIVLPCILILGAVLPITLGWHKRINRSSLGRLIEPGDAPILLLALFVTILWSYSMSVVEVRNDKAYIMPYRDHSSHLSVINELGRTVPMEKAPFVATSKQIGYHLMPDVWCDLIRSTTGADSETAYFYLALTFRYLFLTLACYLALVRRFGKGAAWSGAFITLCITGAVTDAVPLLKTVMFSNWLLHYVHTNYPACFGLLIIFLILFYTSVMKDIGQRTTALLATIFATLLLWYKVNFFLAIAPAVAIFTAVILIKKKDYRWLSLCATVMVSLTCLRQWELSYADFKPILVYQPGAFLGWWWSTLLNTTPGWPMDGFVGDGSVVASLPAPWQWLAVLAICMISMYHVSLLAIPYLLKRCRFRNSDSKMNPADGLSMLILLVTLAGFALLPAQKGVPANVCFPLRVVICALLTPIFGVMVFQFLRYLTRHGKPGIVIASAIIVTTLALNAKPLQKCAFYQTRYRHDTIDCDRLACYRFIRDNSPEKAMVLSPEPERPWTACLLTERRVVLENENLWRYWGYDTLRIALEIKSFYKRHDAVYANNLLQRYGVTHVVADTANGWEPPQGTPLTLVFQQGNSAVYTVNNAMTINTPTAKELASAKQVAVDSDRHQ